MGDITKIQWTSHTFNPWIGCTKVHAGCTHCYAERDFDTRRGVAQWGAHGTRVVTSDVNWRKPLTWNRAAEKDGVRRRVFCASLADVFEDWGERIHDSHGNALWTNEAIGVFEVDDGAEGFAFRRHWTTLDEVRRRLFALVDATPWLDWQLLTKRPENIGRMWPEVAGVEYVPEAGRLNDWSLNRRENVWLGCSVSDQETANRMIPELLKCRDLAPVLFVSAEPLLGPIDLDECGATPCDVAACDIVPARSSDGIDWIIVGGESGPQSRRCDVAWVRSLISQCKPYGVPCFVKQLGANIIDRNDAGFDADWHDGKGWPTMVVDVDEHIDGYLTEFQGAPVRVRTPDKKGGDPSEWPEDLRVREFPAMDSR